MPSVSVPRARIADGSLPSVCVVCGDRAERRYFPGVSSPSLAWVLFSPLLGLLSFWVYVILPGRGGTGEEGLPFCEWHRGYWPRRGWFIVSGFAALVAVFAVASAVSPPAEPRKEQQAHWLFGVAGCWMLLFLPAFLIVHMGATRPTGNARKSLTLARVHPDFVAAFEDKDEDAEPGAVADGGA